MGIRQNILDLPYSTWKILVQNDNLSTAYETTSRANRVIIYAGNGEQIIRATVADSEYTDWSANFQSTAILVGNADEAVAKLVKIPPLTGDNVLRVSTERPEGSRVTMISPDWGDKTTWYYSSTYKENIILTDSGDGYNFYIDPDDYNIAIIDNSHGKYTNEDFLTNIDGYLPGIKIYVDGYEKTEQDPHFDSGGDFVCNYTDGYVTFFVQQAGTVTMDYCEAGSSLWVLKPEPGKKLKIVGVEVQFSKNICIKDTVKFQAYGLVDVFAPQYTPVPYPSGTLIPLKNPTVYKTMMDYINEANGAMPIIPKNSISNHWRDLQEDVIIYPWDYQAVTTLSSAGGMEISIQLEHDTPFEGHATATFYCLSYNE